jgi:hypothetical protein
MADGLDAIHESQNAKIDRQLPAPVLNAIHPNASPADTHERISNAPASELINAKRIEMTFMTAPPFVPASSIQMLGLQILLRDCDTPQLLK